LHEDKHLEVQVARSFALVQEKEVFVLLESIDLKSLSKIIVCIHNMGSFEVMFLKAVAVAGFFGEFNIKIKFYTNKALVINLLEVFKWAASVSPLGIVKALLCSVGVDFYPMRSSFPTSSYLPVIVGDFHFNNKRSAGQTLHTFDGVVFINKGLSKDFIKLVVHTIAK